MEMQYTNVLTPELKASLNRPSFSPEQKSVMGDDARLHVEAQEAFLREHPVVAIYRVATEGSQSREGGVIKQGNSGQSIQLNNGHKVQGARTGDSVIYEDGSTAIIISGAGKAMHDNHGHSIALVGSRLSNGDEIISSPQSTALIAQREGVPLCDDFLKEVGNDE
ncbi:PAAR domain-containing protein [Rahnella selenatireducens]|uniref:hypothetical protein n=1 Tax=Rahnella selenatireducens TaxID=3389797 RepID=UPI0039698517